MTTIGYGFYAPSTKTGKIFCIFYAVMTVPLFLSSLTTLSAAMANGIRSVASWLRKNEDHYCSIFFHRLGKKSDARKKRKWYIIGILALGLLYTLLSAIVFAREHDGWSYLDGVYFCFITLSTIGLGDYLPTLQEHEVFLFILYSFVGLLLVGSITNLMQEFFSAGAEKVAHSAVRQLKGPIQAVRESSFRLQGSFRLPKQASERGVSSRQVSSLSDVWKNPAAA